VFVNELELDFRALGLGIKKMRIYKIDTPDGQFRINLVDNKVNKIEY